MEYQIYLICAIVGCSLIGIQVLLQLFGLMGDTDVDGDGGHDLGADGHGNLFFGVLSIKALTAFVGIFGLVGLIVLDTSLSGPLRVLVSVTAGFGGMFLMGRLMYMLHQLHASGTVDIRNTIGETGRVYLRVPENNLGRGKVTVTVQGRSMEFEAMTDGELLPTGTQVHVLGIEGDTLKVAATARKPTGSNM